MTVFYITNIKKLNVDVCALNDPYNTTLKKIDIIDSTNKAKATKKIAHTKRKSRIEKKSQERGESRFAHT